MVRRRKTSFTPPSALKITKLSLADELGFDVTLKRSPRRRTIEIVIKTTEVELMLPQFVSDREGLDFVRQKRLWILRTIEKHNQLIDEAVPKSYGEGELFTYMGVDYPLRIYLATQKSAVQLSNGVLSVGIRTTAGSNRAEAVKKAVWGWYQERALDVLTEKTVKLATTIGREVSAVTLRRTKTKWGHCTSEGIIQYNWMIMMAPEPVIDYLVAHEVSHLVHRNHGVRFWNHVERLYPDYLKHQTWLKQNGHKLLI